MIIHFDFSNSTDYKSLGECLGFTILYLIYYFYWYKSKYKSILATLY